MTPIKRILRVDEAAQILDVSVRTIYRLVDEGLLEALRLRDNNSPLRIPSESIDAFIEARKKAFGPNSCDTA